MARGITLKNLDDQLKLGSIRWRYWRGNNGEIAVWTTERMYDGGDYLAAFWDGERVVERKFFPKRVDAKKQAHWWWLTTVDYVEYKIEEEP